MIKLFWLITAAAMFPVAVLWMQSSRLESVESKASSYEVPANRSNSIEQDHRLSKTAEDALKKISEIDAKIQQTKLEIQERETERSHLASELAKIQRRIADVLESSPQ